MAWYGTVSKLTLGAGAILLTASCSGRKEVAMSAKDDTIRSQNSQLAYKDGLIESQKKETQAAMDESQRAAELNKQLAKQNEELAERDAKIASENNARTASLQQEVADMDAQLKALSKVLTEVKPNGGAPEGGSGFDRRSDGTIHIYVANTTLFDAGQADLKSSSHGMLMNVAHTLKTQFPHNFIRVEGHTDSTPVVHNKAKFPDNMALSIARSRAVYDFLNKQAGIPASKMYTAGYGEYQPLVHPERTAADRSKNRRVEIVIMPENVKVKKEQLASAAPKK